MTQYFIKEYEKFGNDKPRVVKIHHESTLKDLFQFLQENKRKSLSVYEAECVLDWS